MRRFLLVLLLAGFTLACPSYPYHDFTWASDYQQPQRPPDSLIDDCRNLNLSDSNLCNLIQNSNFSEYEKKRVLLDDLVKNVGQPPFTEAESWSQALNYAKYPPDGIAQQSSSYIKNAWIAITGLNPSLVKPGNNTYVNDSGNVLLSYNFSFVVPRETFASDCRTDYEVCGYDYILNAFNNGRQLARNGLAASFQSEVQNNFSAVLSVNSEYLIHHYKLVKHCKRCGWTCESSGDEDRTDALTVEAGKTALLEQPNLTARVFVDDFRNGLLDAWLKINRTQDYDRVKLSIGNSWLEIQDSEYKLEYNLTPYNPLFVASNASTRPLQTHELSILAMESGNESETIHFLAPAPELNCSLEITSHFQKIVTSDACFFNQTQQPVLNLTVVTASTASFTALALFTDNSTNSPLTSKNLSFSYGNQTQSVQTNSEGIARATFNYSYGTNLVYVEFKTDFETKSARAYAVVPASSPDFLGIILFWAGLLFALWLAHLFWKRQFQ